MDNVQNTTIRTHLETVNQYPGCPASNAVCVMYTCTHVLVLVHRTCDPYQIHVHVHVAMVYVHVYIHVHVHLKICVQHTSIRERREKRQS